MKKMTKREISKEEKREAIIDAAEKVFLTNGFEISTIDDITKEAGFSKRTIYVYFESKKHIIYAIMSRSFDILNSILINELEKQKNATGLEKIRTMFLVVYKFRKEHPGYFKVIMDYKNVDLTNDVLEKKDYILKNHEDGIKFLSNLTQSIIQCQNEGIIDKDKNPKELTLIIWGSYAGILDLMTKKEQFIKHYFDQNSDEVIMNSIDYLIDSIVKKSNN